MDIIEGISVIAAVYFFLVFVVLRLVVPFMGFGDFALPLQIPDKVRNKITELENRTTSPMDYLNAAYIFVTGNWHASRLNTIFYAPLAFRKNLSEIISNPGYAHCNTQNYLLFVLLAGSKYFKPNDIKAKYVFVNFFIHQYLEVKTIGQSIDADPAGASIRGKPLGYHLVWFG